MTPMKIFIIVLVVIAVLFFAGIGGGISRGSSQPGNSADFRSDDSPLARFQNGVFPARPLQVSDLASPLPPNCIPLTPTPGPQPVSSELRVPAGRICSVAINSALLPARKQLNFKLASTPPSAVATVVLVPIVDGKEGLPIAKGLSPARPVFDPSEQAELQVYRDGGTLNIGCRAGGADCRIQLLK